MPFPEVLAGETLPGAELQRFGSDTVLWTPSIDAATTDPTYGTGAEREGWYTQQGRLCVGGAIIKFGTGMTGGTGTYNFPLPVAFLDVGLSRYIVGPAQAIDIGSSATRVGAAVWTGGAGLRLIWEGNDGDTTPAIPFTWADTDVISWGFCYPADW